MSHGVISLDCATKERPILFSGPMVRALLADRKTQTRRVVKPQPETDTTHWRAQSTMPRWWRSFPSKIAVQCPYGQPGDRLWVRERHCFLDVSKSSMSNFPLGPQNNNERGPTIWNVCVEYSDGTQHETSVEKERPKQTRVRGEIAWRPSIHMPRWACRLVLEVTAVRVERLQAITEADARAEGAEPAVAGQDAAGPLRTHRTGFVHLWQSINGTWLENPWVWVVEFKRA